MESVDDMLRGNTDSRNKQLGSTVNNYGDELVKLSFRVIVAFGIIVSIRIVIM